MKIIAYNCSQQWAEENKKDLNFQEGFTTNKDYVGHLNDKPVYVREDIKEGIDIVEESKIEDLEEGKYQGKIIQTYGKNNDGKEKVIIEYQINGDDKKYYTTFNLKGFSPIQEEIANKKLNTLLKDFGFTHIEQLKDIENVFIDVVKKGEFTNVYFHKEDKKFAEKIEWPYACKIPKATLVSVCQKTLKDGREIGIAKVDVPFQDKILNEEIPYFLWSEFQEKMWNEFLAKFGLENIEKDKIINLGVKGNFVVTKKEGKDGKIWTNKFFKKDNPKAKFKKAFSKKY